MLLEGTAPIEPGYGLRRDVMMPSRGTRASIWAWARWLLLAITILFVVRAASTGWPEIRSAMQTITRENVHLVVVAIGVESLWVLTLAQVYRSALVAFGGTADFRLAIRVSMSAFTLSRVLPGGGAVGALFAAREFIRGGNRNGITLIALVAAGWVSLSALGVVVLVAIGGGVMSGTLPISYLIPPVLVLGVLLIVGAVAVIAAKRPACRRSTQGLLVRLFGSWGVGLSRNDLEHALRTVPRLRDMFRVFTWSSISWVLDAAALGLVFAAFGYPLEVAVLAVGYGVANLIQALPELTPGWLGVLEGSLSVTYASLGVPAGAAVVVILVYRLISFWMPVAAGLPFAWGIMRAQKGKKALERP